MPRRSKRLTIGFVYDLRKDYLAEGFTPEQVGEFDSEETIAAIAGVLRSLGHRVDRIGHARALCARLAAGDRWDLVFNIAEGVSGRSREAQAPCLLELYRIPYSFSDPLVCATTLDKAVAKRLVRSAGVHTPEFHVVRTLADLRGIKLRYPLFAKPIAEGTGKGVDGRSKVTSPVALRSVCARLLRVFHQPVLVEEYLPGREFTVGILGTGAKARAIGTMEIVIKAGAPAADYSFEIKELCEQYCEYPFLKRGALRRAVESVAVEGYRALECRDGGRVDVRLDRRGRPAFIEVNPLPGLHPTHSDLPMIARDAGMSYADLIGSILQSALTRVNPSRA
jgi:D-alanine-D-alanine ligase